MSIGVQCSGCGKRLKARDELAGKQARCPACGQLIVVRAAPQPAQPNLPTSSPRTLRAVSGGETEPLPGSQRKRPRWLWCAAGGVAALCVVAIAVFIVTSLRKDRLTAAPEDPAPSLLGRDQLAGPGTDQSTAPAQLAGGQQPTRALRGSATGKAAIVSSLRIVSTRLEEGSQSVTYPMTGSYRVYTLRLVLENDGEVPMFFGDNCTLFETTSDGNTFDGVVQTRLPLFPKDGPRPVDRRNRFLINNVQSVDDEGEGDPATGGASPLQALLSAISHETAANPSYGTLWPRERMVLRLKYKVGSGVKPEFLSRITSVSPVVFGEGQSRVPLGVVLCEFKNPDTAGKGNQDGTRWKLLQNSILSLDSDTLANRIEDNRSPAVMRVLALNLLADFHAQQAIEVARARLSAINEANGNVRSAAIQILGLLGDRPSVPSLMKFLSNDQPEGLRQVAASVLGNMRASDAVEGLVACAWDKEKSVATAAVAALGKINCASAVSSLDKLAADSAYAHAADAVRALGDSGAAAVVPLERALADKRPDVAEAAAATLGQLLQPDALEKLEGYDEKAQEERARLSRELDPALVGSAGAQALVALEKAVLDPRADVAASAVDAYAGVPGKHVSVFLLGIADRGNGPLVAVLGALSKRREPDAGTRVLKYLTPATPKEVCEAAISAAVELKLTAAQTPLMQLARTGEESTRWRSADALGELKAENARNLLEAILGDSTQPSMVRWSVLKALKRLPGGPREAILLKVANRRDDDTRWGCLEALCESSSEAARSAVQAALAETAESEKAERDSLKQQWDKSSGKKPLDLNGRLASASEDDRWEAVYEVEKKKDATAIPALKRILGNETSPKVLGELGDTFVALNCRDRDVLEAFLNKLQLEKPDAVQAAAKSLRSLTDRKIGPYGGESASELAEDVQIWRSSQRNILP